MPEKKDEIFDVIIIGGGASGLSAGLYCARFGLRTLVLTKERYGLLALTHVVENYPGLGVLSGLEMMQKMEQHAAQFGVDVREEEVTDVAKHGDCFTVKTKNGNGYVVKAIIFATGTQRRKLNVPGEKEFSNKGVSYCATCDGPLFKGKVVAVVGGSDSAAKEALLMTEYATKVYIIYRGPEIHPEPINGERVKELVKKGKIEIIPNTNVVEIKGSKTIEKLILDKPYKGSKEFPVQGVFIEVGGIPQSQLAAKLGVKLNDNKEIIIDRNAKTNVEGIYAAGDVVDTEFKQALTGAAEGILAANSAYNYIGGKAVVCR